MSAGFPGPNLTAQGLQPYIPASAAPPLVPSGLAP